MNFLTFILIFVVVIYLIYFFTSEDNEGAIDEFLATHGYVFQRREGYKISTLPKPRYIFFSKEELEIDLVLGPRKDGDDADFYRIMMKAPISIPLYFKISTPYQIKKENYSLIDNSTKFMDLNIQTYNPLQIQNLFSSEGFYSLFKNILEECLRFEVSSATKYFAGESEDADKVGNDVELKEGYELKIEVDIKDTAGMIENAIRIGEQIITIMRSKSRMIFKLDVEESYQCFKCGNDIPFEGDLCRYCGTIAPKCVICFSDPEPDEAVLLFNCCKSYAHHDHARTWLENNARCPYCSKEDPILIEVNETHKF